MASAWPLNSTQLNLTEHLRFAMSHVCLHAGVLLPVVRLVCVCVPHVKPGKGFPAEQCTVTRQGVKQTVGLDSHRWFQVLKALTLDPLDFKFCHLPLKFCNTYT